MKALTQVVAMLGLLAYLGHPAKADDGWTTAEPYKDTEEVVQNTQIESTEEVENTTIKAQTSEGQPVDFTATRTSLGNLIVVVKPCEERTQTARRSYSRGNRIRKSYPSRSRRIIYNGPSVSYRSLWQQIRKQGFVPMGEFKKLAKRVDTLVPKVKHLEQRADKHAVQIGELYMVTDGLETRLLKLETSSAPAASSPPLASATVKEKEPTSPGFWKTVLDWNPQNNEWWIWWGVWILLITVLLAVGNKMSLDWVYTAAFVVLILLVAMILIAWWFV